MQSIIVTTTTTVTTESNVGRAAVLHSNRYGAIPTLGRGGDVIHVGYIENGRAGYMYETGLVGVVVSETPTAYRVRILNGAHKGEQYTICKAWVTLG
ncbi:hypothetical protein SEA_BIG4_360 [Microbacterium phage Big4]|nr:hypothetical protein SEA_BIG4_34 [Microbacterium phage Big4]URP22393.1 hypothetical protein SEA_BIG4_360 [Microbacterium phage Big4]